MAGYFTGGVGHKYSISIYQYIYNCQAKFKFMSLHFVSVIVINNKM
jgi:hypothetical protein